MSTHHRPPTGSTAIWVTAIICLTLVAVTIIGAITQHR